MKIRNGFVSNSSSSSFVVRMSDLTTDQLDKIYHHLKYKSLLNDIVNSEILSLLKKSDQWKLTITSEFIIGETDMNNFPMDVFLKIIGIKEENVFWDNNPYRL